MLQILSGVLDLYSDWKEELMCGDQQWHLVSSNGTRLLLPKKMLFVGRDPKSDICLQASDIEPQHAILSYNQRTEKFRVKDRGSLNGTYVNDYRLPQEQYHTLEHCHSIRFGSGPMSYCVEGSEHVRGERRVAASQAAMSGWATRRAPTGLAECRGCIAEHGTAHTCSLTHHDRDYTAPHHYSSSVLQPTFSGCHAGVTTRGVATPCHSGVTLSAQSPPPCKWQEPAGGMPSQQSPGMAAYPPRTEQYSGSYHDVYPRYHATTVLPVPLHATYIAENGAGQRAPSRLTDGHLASSRLPSYSHHASPDSPSETSQQPADVFSKCVMPVYRPASLFEVTTSNNALNSCAPTHVTCTTKIITTLPAAMIMMTDNGHDVASKKMSQSSDDHVAAVGASPKMRQDKRRSLSDTDADLDTVKGSTPLYGQPAWWGDWYPDPHSDDPHAADPGQGHGHGQASSGHSAVTPLCSVLPPSWVRGGMAEVGGGAAGEERDGGGARTPPQRDCDPPGGRGSDDSAELNTCGMAFTVEFGPGESDAADVTSPPKMSMHDSLSQFLPHKVRRSFRERAVRTSSDGDDPDDPKVAPAASEGVSSPHAGRAASKQKVFSPPTGRRLSITSPGAQRKHPPAPPTTRRYDPTSPGTPRRNGGKWRPPVATAISSEDDDMKLTSDSKHGVSAVKPSGVGSQRSQATSSLTRRNERATATASSAEPCGGVRSAERDEPRTENRGDRSGVKHGDRSGVMRGVEEVERDAATERALFLVSQLLSGSGGETGPQGVTERGATDEDAASETGTYTIDDDDDDEATHADDEATHTDEMVTARNNIDRVFGLVSDHDDDDGDGEDADFLRLERQCSASSGQPERNGPVGDGTGQQSDAKPVTRGHESVVDNCLPSIRHHADDNVDTRPTNTETSTEGGVRSTGKESPSWSGKHPTGSGRKLPAIPDSSPHANPQTRTEQAVHCTVDCTTNSPNEHAADHTTDHVVRLLSDHGLGQTRAIATVCFDGDRGEMFTLSYDVPSLRSPVSPRSSPRSNPLPLPLPSLRSPASSPTPSSSASSRSPIPDPVPTRSQRGPTQSGRSARLPPRPELSSTSSNESANRPIARDVQPVSSPVDGSLKPSGRGVESAAASAAAASSPAAVGSPSGRRRRPQTPVLEARTNRTFALRKARLSGGGEVERPTSADAAKRPTSAEQGRGGGAGGGTFTRRDGGRHSLRVLKTPSTPPPKPRSRRSVDGAVSGGQRSSESGHRSSESGHRSSESEHRSSVSTTHRSSVSTTHRSSVSAAHRSTKSTGNKSSESAGHRSSESGHHSSVSAAHRSSESAAHRSSEPAARSSESGHRSTDTGHRSAPSSRSSSPQSAEYSAWRRRKDYDPRRSAKTGRGNASHDTDSGGEGGGAGAPRARSADTARRGWEGEGQGVTCRRRRAGDTAGRQVAQQIAQLSSVIAHDLGVMTSDTTLEISRPRNGNCRSPGGKASPPPTGVNCTPDESDHSSLISSIYRLSHKVKVHSEHVLSRFRDGEKDHYSQSTDEASYSDTLAPSSYELGAVLRNLTRTEQQLKELDRTLFTSPDNDERDRQRYLVELERISNEIAEFKAVDGSSKRNCWTKQRRV